MSALDGKLDQGEFDQVSGGRAAGLARQDVYPISTELCLPAPGQGALGIECVMTVQRCSCCSHW